MEEAKELRSARTHDCVGIVISVDDSIISPWKERRDFDGTDCSLTFSVETGIVDLSIWLNSPVVDINLAI